MNQQNTLDLPTTAQPNEDHFTFEPIKGYPMLNWRGKRPFTSTAYYPAQLKEQHGQAVNGWLNKIFWGDNLQVMAHLLKEYRGKVDLIYIDPPFDSKADYKKKITIKNQDAENDLTAFEEKQYTDLWSNDEYLQYLFQRLVLLKELLSNQGSIFVHCDYHKSHYIRCLLDEVFGSGLDASSVGYKNEIIWCYSVGGKSRNKFGEKHDTIFWYTKSGNWIFNESGARVSRKPNSHMKLLVDEEGREYQQKIDAKTGKVYTYYMDEGKVAEDYWIDIETLNWEASERENYPTQKPEKLIKRIIETCSMPNSIIFDCFMGSGTTQTVAMKLGRRFIGADINLGAIQTTTKRLIKVAQELEAKQAELENVQPDLPISEEDNESETTPTTYYTGFEVYNVNHYDVFRNPVQAKDLLIEALGIQRIPNSIYDGEKDGRMVKIMPINRIATRADINELVAGVDYKAYEERSKDYPNRVVEKMLLVCMGHEPDLAAALKQAIGYKIDVEIVDILRDKTDLQFKRDSEAKLVIENQELIIKQFYPMNLLQKLSQTKESVSDWREMVESVMVDWNYDGVLFQPSVTDIPSKSELVIGHYPIPEDAGTIRVKITDLLSESWEGEING